MGALSLSHSLRRLWALERFGSGLRFFIALAGCMAWCWYHQQMELLTPLFLGVIASALAESDDSWQGRLFSACITLIFFFLTALSVELLYPYPWLFVVALSGSTFWLIMLGALGERYATMAFATLILAIYTMIGLEQSSEVLVSIWQQPILLVTGAAVYGVLSVIWYGSFSQQPLQHSLARLFREQCAYLKAKSALFEPLRNMDIEGHRLAIAKQNSRVVAALNDTKSIILHRVGGRNNSKVNRYLKLYFLAQDIHERASSSHYPYQKLSEAFFHSDVLFRCLRLLRQQGDGCKALAKAIEMRQPFDYGGGHTAALEDLQGAIAYLKQQNNPEWRDLLRSLRALANNLSTLDHLLRDAANPDVVALTKDDAILDRDPHTFKEAFERVLQHLSIHSLLFRHALRLSIAVAACYGIMLALHPNQGYWILLTAVFVCRPNYGATRARLIERIIGTLIGLGASWVLFELFPQLWIQALIAVAAGVAYFTTRTSHYKYSTAFITLMVLFCFNQIGDGYNLFIPRLTDTLIGSAVAGLAVFLILPDWQARRLNVVLAQTLRNNGRYLQQIMQEYTQGKTDDMAYRVARRDAHNADATLSSTLTNMLKEPGHFRRQTDIGFRFLLLSHTLLSYISALGAHREKLAHAPTYPLLNQDAQLLAASLEEIAQQLIKREPIEVHSETEQQLTYRLRDLPEEEDDTLRLLQTQLLLISQQLGSIRTLAAHVLNKT
ncbi:YccS family putative transporter [Denitrificimonas sp. JX-1]|uniref:YccS family putative transporter n=1 Tax=Denitrificimonas halotolerans TaxID=3098930 RepID=A0ABU5GNT1_9GAMM|nr:YccS family putative transporter [Denitrificimonas sp. JX-1]MDY7218389.1 YccS family putative transporter [Denitrificimonas sp. JX-1]